MKNKTAGESTQRIIPFRQEGSLITHLQEMVARRFGAEINSETGAGTLAIAADRVSLTDATNRVIAETAQGCSKALGQDGEDGQFTVTLDRLAGKMVRWYAEENDRGAADVVNGVLAGELSHLKEDGRFDDTAEHIEEYVLGAIDRRKATKAA